MHPSDPRAYLFTAELWLPRLRSEVFPFFAEAKNLESITPPWLQFRILTPSPIEMRTGTRIDYQIKIHGIPVRWKTEIATWEPPQRFIDVQLSGPYRLWHHTHTFSEQDGGTLCQDQVRYYPIGGALIHRLFVRRQVEQIFQYRRQRLLEIFPP